MFSNFEGQYQDIRNYERQRYDGLQQMKQQIGYDNQLIEHKEMFRFYKKEANIEHLNKITNYDLVKEDSYICESILQKMKEQGWIRREDEQCWYRPGKEPINLPLPDNRDTVDKLRDEIDEWCGDTLI